MPDNESVFAYACNKKSGHGEYLLSVQKLSVIKNTFHFYDSFDCPTIITTDLSPEEAAGRMAEMIE